MAEFHIPNDVIYLDGNSLGPLPYKAKNRALEVVNQQWGEDLIASWNTHDWIGLPLKVGNKIAPLIGAVQNSVVCCDSISVNLFKVLSAALKINANRTKILSQTDNFPTDLYMAQGLVKQLNGIGGNDEKYQLVTTDADVIFNTLEQDGNDIAILMLTHVNFRSGDSYDIERLTQLAHAKGVLVVWDLAHSAGVLPLSLSEWQVDFAVGCTYKFLNGGPGAPGFVYVAPHLMDSLDQPLSGWMGHKKPFSFDPSYTKANGIQQFLCGTPSIISMSVLDAALDVFDGISIARVRDKSIALNSFFQSCVEQLLGSSLTLACPFKAQDRGSQISFQHPQAYAICQALISKNVIADFRAPNILRLGFSPLFLRFKDVLIAAQILSEIISSEIFLKEEFHIKNTVT